MDKTYHFMAGLPRSGSTVLSAILNQNPEVYSSPQTDLVGMLYNLEQAIPNYESYRAGVFYDGYMSVMKGMADNFYTHIDKPVIIDKNRGWGTPYNFNELSGYLNVDGKVILTMRPILEVLASFVKVIRASEKITKQVSYFNQNLWVSSYRDQTEAIVDNLMMPNGEIDRSIFSISNLLKNHRDRVYIVWFDDLTENPEQTMKGIYDFLGIDGFDHNFNNIKEVDKQDDLNAFGILGLHDIKKKLAKPKTDPSELLSDYVIQKYGNALDFLNL
jgi:sulfotransferase